MDWQKFKESYPFLTFLAVLVGIISGIGAIFFRTMINFFIEVFYAIGPKLFSFMGKSYYLIAPALGGLIIGPIIHHAASETKGHGVPEIMEAVWTKGGKIRPRVALIKPLVSAICIGSGCSAGREGPIAQIGASSGSTIGQLLGISPQKLRVLVACGAGAGIAATFNAPIAGIFFAMEVILAEFRTRSFIPAVVATVTSTSISRRFLGDYPALGPLNYSLKSYNELPLYVGLGILAGVIGILEIDVLYKFEGIFEKLKVIPPYILPALGGLFLGSMGLVLPHVLGVGYGENLLPPLTNALIAVIKESIDLKLMIILVFAKILATSITLGTGGSGGVFAPSLFIGGMLGGAYGYIMNNLFPDITAGYGAYALAGMAALFSGVSRATLTSMIILFEMTRDYEIILPTLLSCVVSDTIVVFSGRNIYIEKLLRKGIKAKPERPPDVLDMTLIREMMKKGKGLITVKKEMNVKEVYELMERTGYHGFPVVDDKGRISGLITHNEIEDAMTSGLWDAKVERVMIRDPLMLYPDETLREALLRIGIRRASHFPVVDRRDRRKLVGFVAKTDIISAYVERTKEIEWFPK